jgi:hypothetical protein
MFIVEMDETSSSKILLIPLKCQHEFDEQLELGMCEEALGSEKRDFYPSETK